MKYNFQIDIVKHPGEVEGKSTAVHAKLLAGDQVNIHIWPDIPDYTEVNKLVISLYRLIDKVIFRNKLYLYSLGKKVNHWSITVPYLQPPVIAYFHSPRLSSLTPRGISVTRSVKIQEYIPCLRS